MFNRIALKRGAHSGMRNRSVTMDKPTITMADYGGYYGAQAYCSDSIPDQPVQSQDLNHSKLGRSAAFRLPWGGALDVIPPIVMESIPPKALRQVETHGGLLDGTGFQGELNHECIQIGRAHV